MAPKDDRAPHDISWAATNLVKTDLLKNRQSVHILPPNLQKESPGTSAFPPTPPPEKDGNKVQRANTTSSRANSVRRPPELKERRNDSREMDRDREDDYSPPARRPTVRDQGPRRAASSASRRNPSRSGTVSSRRRPQERIEEYSDQEEQYEDDLYDLYNAEPRRNNTVRRGLSRRGTTKTHRYDDDEYASDAYEGSSLDEDEFEMLDARSMRSAGSRRVPDPKKVCIANFKRFCWFN